MCPNVAPDVSDVGLDSGNKPGAITALVVAHQIYQSILISRGSLASNHNLTSGALGELSQQGR